ncbi:hypothetical protein [Burkholderia sp. IDO3]|uniref:hypothetical protein n=1 Tax=Burkholderia sp. IDO3 TaxID=1705310 RepID=UPI001177E063|nr:hypothetical protein [Burkholderia sp. IDO3]
MVLVKRLFDTQPDGMRNILLQEGWLRRRNGYFLLVGGAMTSRRAGAEFCGATHIRIGMLCADIRSADNIATGMTRI